MNRVDVLCTMDRFMMKDFSDRTVNGLKGYTIFRLALPTFKSFLDINVDKEVEKDRMVIALAGNLQQSGISPDSGHVNTLLQQARKIDQAFVHKTAIFPVEIKIQYQDIERYRQQRIELLLQASFKVLAQWHERRSFRVAINELYSKTGFQNLLHELLRLYAMETRMLSRSVSMPGLFSMARDAVTQTITNVMEREAEALARSLAYKVYSRRI